ncbi:MAG: hypothetical protein IKA07_07670 [Alistipes sp.]|nr:hypothetical protein [Alistipes sp.]
MTTGILFFGLLSGGLFLDVLVGLLGSRRNIGFGWAFILSLLLTPLVGLIIVLISDPLPEGAERKLGCLGSAFGILGAIALIAFIAFIILAVIGLAAA